MQDQQLESLKTYIAGQLQLGQTPDEISAQLKTAGWTDEHVAQGFHALQATMLPTAMQTEKGAQPATLPAAFGKRRGRIRTGWVLLKQSVKLLNGNRYLLRFLLMTWLVILLTEAIFFAIVFFGWRLFTGADGDDNVWWYVFVFFSYLITYFIINFYAAALSANILDIFQGRRQAYQEYIRAARGKAWPIFVFSLIESIVGMFLRMIVERIRFVGWLLSWLLGAVWSLGTTFVLPIVMSSDTKAVPAIKQSIGFFKKTWGENVVAKATVNAPLALISIALSFIMVPLIVFAVLSDSMLWFWMIFIPVVIISITLAIIGSFATSVINVALYYYATTQQVPPNFTSDMLNSVFVERKHFKRGIVK